MNPTYFEQKHWIHTLTTRSCLITSLLILFLTAFALVGINRFGTNSRVTGRTGTIQAQQIDKKVVDDPKEAYRIWRDAGYRGRTIVFIADRWESFDPGELIPAQMFRAYPLQLYNTARLMEDDYLNGITFLYIASLNKIIRKIVMIAPDSEVGRMKVSAAKAKDSAVSEKAVFISRQGFPRWYTTAANFTAVKEPVLLYIGASYFKHVQPEELFRMLSASGLQTDCVVLCREKGKDSATENEIIKLGRFAALIGITPPSAGSGSMTQPTSKQQNQAPAL